MQYHISTRPLTEEEWEQIENILLDELEIQVWYGVVVLRTLEGELLIPIQ